MRPRRGVRRRPRPKPESGAPVSADRPEWVVLGRIAGAYGVRGWLRVASHTEPREGILAYRQWWLEAQGARRCFELLDGRRQGRGVVAALAGVGEREAARALAGAAVTVPRESLPADEGYYWADLIGLAVHNRDGTLLGTITGYVPTGGHDVMVVAGSDRERLIPWAPGTYVDAVRLDEGRVLVDWHPED